MRLPRLVATVVVALVLGTLPAAAEEPTAVALPKLLTLDEALRIFRAHGLDLLIAEAAVAAAEGDARIANAIPNPNFNAGVYRSFYSSGLFESPWGYVVGLGDSNAIEDTLSGKRHLRNRVAEAALRAARMSRLDAERTLTFMVKQLYLQAVLARDQLDFALEVQKASDQTFKLIRLRFEKGAINEADEAKAETAKLEADQAVRIAQQALEVAKAQLAFLLGARGQLPDFLVAADLPTFRVPPALANATRDSLVQRAFETRPDLKAIDWQRKRAEASVALAQRLRFPDLSLNLQYSAQGTADGGCPTGTARDASGNCFNPTDMTKSAPTTPISPPTLFVSVAGNLPIFYQQQGEIIKTTADLRAQQLLFQKISAQLISDVAQGYSNYAATRELVERMEGRLLERARKARDLVLLQYEKGAASLLEYLDAQRTFIATNVEYLQDLANYWIAVSQVEAAIGTELK